MELTLTGEYAVRVLIYIATNPEKKSFHIKELSKECAVPDQYLRKIIPQLTKSGILTSQRGNGGGVSLSKLSDKISLLEVIESVEGEIFLNKCLISSEFCNRTSWCEVHCVWIEARERMRDTLSSRSIKYLAEQSILNKHKLSA
ncbi:MAG: Rrf2 family transcriptional regulator [Bacteroidota bacterium]